MRLFSGRKQKENIEDIKESSTGTGEEAFSLSEDNQYTKTKEQMLQYAENCCDQMIMCQKRLETAKKEYGEVNHYLTDISTIENLEGEKKENLIFEAKRIETLKEDKKSCKSSAAKMSEKKYEYISSHESEMPKILKELKESEDEFQAVKADLHNIEGEKSALKYERKLCIQRMNVLRKLLKLVLLLTAILLAAFAYGQYKGEYDYTIGFYIVIVTAMAIIAVIFSVNQNQTRKLKITELKLNKAIGLLNRYKLRYVNIKSSLDYFYQIYGAANSYELSNLWRIYLTSKKEREAYFTMSDNLYKSVENYMSIINSLNLYDSSVWNYQTKAVINREEMDIIRETLYRRRESLRKNIDYNNEVIYRSKEKIKELIEREPSLSEDILAMLDRKTENEEW